MATQRQQRGAEAEEEAARLLRLGGWQVLARNVRLGRDEIDLLALDPGPPPALVCVEVRSATSSRFGAPEERVDSAKVAHLYRAAAAVARAITVGDERLPALPLRVDLVVIDWRSQPPAVRHLRGLERA